MLIRRWLRLVLLGGISGCWAGLPAQAWVLDIGTNNPRRLFLQVGIGHTDVSQWGTDVGTVNLVSVTVPAAQLGNGVAQPMSSNSTQALSPYDGYTVCVPSSNQVYVGAAYQRRNASQPNSATLQVTAPANLDNGAGDTIPFSQISWTTSALGSAQPNIIPAGSFPAGGGTLFLVSMTAGMLVENCHSFSYANSNVRPAGTYQGRVVYTLTSP